MNTPVKNKALRSSMTSPDPRAGEAQRIQAAPQIKTELVDWPLRDLVEGEVLIRGAYSSLNYKDALGVTGRGRIFKTLPITGGIDIAGEVELSKSAHFKTGDQVLVTGGGLGETHDGGYSTHVIEHESHMVKCPAGLSPREAMIFGTAGFTAALCVERMLQNGQTAEMGPILVTGASGGVGQFAVSFFSHMGFEVHALSGKPELASRLAELGAQKVILPSDLDLGERPLESIRYGGAVDNLGGKTLSQLIAHVQLWGNVACVGLASGHELQATVMPLILRGVSLLGISSNNTPRPLRLKIWERLAEGLKPENLESFVTEVIPLDQVVLHAKQMLARQTHGRILVKLS